MDERKNDARTSLDRFVAGLDYAMFIVTVAVPEAAKTARSGCLVGFVTQCSIDPVRFLVCISKTNHTYPLARRASALGVHVPGAAQRDLAELFGTTTGDDVDKFAACNWREGPGGVPMLTDCENRMTVEVLARMDLGDHEGMLVAPVEVHAGAGPGPGTGPLMFSRVADLEAGHGA